MSVTRGVSRRAGRGRSGRVVGVLGAVAVLAAGTLVATGTPAGAVGSWSTPVDLSASGQVDDSPQIVASGDGNRLAAIWTDWPNRIIQVATSSNGGASWGTPVDLSAPDSYFPQVTSSSDGMRLVAVWERHDGSDLLVQAAASSNGGASWGSPVDLSNTGLNASLASADPQVTGSSDGTRVTALWKHSDGSKIRVQAATSSNGGATWGPPVDLSGAGQNADEPQIDAAADGRHLAAVWKRWNAFNYIVQAATSSDGGASWGSPVDLSAAGQDAWRPQLATAGDGSGMAAIWMRYDGGHWIVQTAASVNAGTSWGPSVDLSAPGQSANWPQVAISGAGSRIVAIWQRRNGISDPNPNDTVQVAVSSSSGVTWSTPVDLSDGHDASFAQIVASSDGTRVTAVWDRWNGANSIVQAASSSNGGATWSTPVDLSATGGDGHHQQIAGSVDGTRLAAVWEHIGSGVIQAATGGNGGPGVVGVWPVSGPDAGGTVVSLSGTGLTGASGVVFGGGAASSVTVVSDTRLTAVTPPHPAGAVEVTVVTPLGSATLPGGFTFTATPPPPPPVPPVVRRRWTSRRRRR